MRTFFISFALLVAGCGDTVGNAPPADAPAADGSPDVTADVSSDVAVDLAVDVPGDLPSDTRTDVAAADAPPADAPPADSAIMCNAGGSGSFPTFEATCMTETDCVVAVHQTDCCGNMQGLGIRSSQRAAFDAAEAICRPMYPGCGCPSRGILCDDGQRTFSPDGVGVACRAGRCATFVRMM